MVLDSSANSLWPPISQNYFICLPAFLPRMDVFIGPSKKEALQTKATVDDRLVSPCIMSNSVWTLRVRSIEIEIDPWSQLCSAVVFKNLELVPLYYKQLITARFHGRLFMHCSKWKKREREKVHALMRSFDWIFASSFFQLLLPSFPCTIIHMQGRSKEVSKRIIWKKLYSERSSI